jgi:integrase
MAQKTRTRRSFGAVRKLPSGRFQASYSIDGVRYNAPETFRTKTDANLYLNTVDSDITRQSWRAPIKSELSLAAYAPSWLKNRDDIKETTRDLYENQLRLHILPALGQYRLPSITPGLIASWNSAMKLKGPTIAAQSYRLLRTLLNQALSEGLIQGNPCTLRNAGNVKVKRTEVMPEVWEIQKITDSTPERYRALVSILAWGGLRIGEALALTRDSFDPRTGSIRVGARIYRLSSGKLNLDTPKTERSNREIVLPDSVRIQLTDHIKRFVRPGADSLIFEANKGGYLLDSTFTQIFKSARERADVRPTIYVHSLRSFAATIAAQQGATLKELMDILGHTSPEIAMRYQRNTNERKRDVASKLDQVRTSNVLVPSLNERRRA